MTLACSLQETFILELKYQHRPDTDAIFLQISVFSSLVMAVLRPMHVLQWLIRFAPFSVASLMWFGDIYLERLTLQPNALAKKGLSQSFDLTVLETLPAFCYVAFAADAASTLFCRGMQFFGCLLGCEARPNHRKKR